MSAGTKTLRTVTAVTMHNAVSQGAGAFNTAGIDILEYEGELAVIQNLGLITGSIGTNKLQHSDTSGGTYSDVDQEGQAFGTAQSASTVVVVNKNKLKRWLRYTGTVTTGPVLISVQFVGQKKYR